MRTTISSVEILPAEGILRGAFQVLPQEFPDRQA